MDIDGKMHKSREGRREREDEIWMDLMCIVCPFVFYV